MELRKKGAGRLWTKTYLLFILMYFGNVSCLYYYSGTMTVIGESLSGSVVLAGALSSVYSLVPLFFRPFIGTLVDRFGRWRSNCVGIIITLFTILGYLFASNIYQLFVLRAIGGLAFCITSIANYTSVTELIPDGRKTEGIGWFQNAGTISTYVGPALALYALALTPDSYLALHVGGIILCVFAFVMNLFVNYEKTPEYIEKRKAALIEEKKKAEELKEKIDAESQSQEVQSGKMVLGMESAVWFLVFAMLLVTCAHSTVNAYLILSAKKRGLTGVSNMFLFMAAGMFVARGFYSKLADEKGLAKIFIPALLVGSACLFIFGFSDNSLLLNIVAFPYGFLFGTAAATCQSNIVKAAPISRRAFASSMYLLAVDVGYGVFPIVTGFIIGYIGYSSIFYVAAVLPLLAVLLVSVFWNKKGKEVFQKGERQ